MNEVIVRFKTPLHGLFGVQCLPAFRMTPNYQGSHQISSYAGAQGAKSSCRWIGVADSAKPGRV